jgi:hypothetical protein
MVEPVTWGRRSRGPLVSAAVALNLISGSALILTGYGSRKRNERSIRAAEVECRSGNSI